MRHCNPLNETFNNVPNSSQDLAVLWNLKSFIVKYYIEFIIKLKVSFGRAQYHKLNLKKSFSNGNGRAAKIKIIKLQTAANLSCANSLKCGLRHL